MQPPSRFLPSGGLPQLPDDYLQGSGPLHLAGAQTTPIRLQPAADIYDMVRVGIEGRPLTATAVLAWSGDLPRELQQVLFDTADGITYDELSAAAS